MLYSLNYSNLLLSFKTFNVYGLKNQFNTHLTPATPTITTNPTFLTKFAP